MISGSKAHDFDAFTFVIDYVEENAFFLCNFYYYSEYQYTTLHLIYRHVWILLFIRLILTLKLF